MLRYLCIVFEAKAHATSTNGPLCVDDAFSPIFISLFFFVLNGNHGRYGGLCCLALWANLVTWKRNEGRACKLQCPRR